MCPLFSLGVHGDMGNLFNRCRRCFLYLVLLIPLVGYAETIPLPNISQPTKIYWRTDSYAFNPDVSSALGQTPESFCQQIFATKGYTYSTFVMGSSTGNCRGTANGWNVDIVIQRRYKCSETSTDTFTSPQTCTIAACPDSTWTKEGNSCTRPDCPAGFDRGADGQCLKDCTGKRGMTTVNNGYEFVGAVSNWSVGGCRVRCEQRVLASGGGMGYSCKFTGASATPDNPEAEALPPDPKELPPEEPKDCLGKGQGFIKSSSGKITCIPASDAPAGNKPDAVESESTKEKGKPGDAGYVKEETTRACSQ